MFTSLLLAIIVLPIPLVILIDKRHKRKLLKSILAEFRSASSREGLFLSSQEVLRNAVIGLDGLQRKLLIVERNSDESYQSLLIDLSEVQRCTVERTFRSVSRGDSAPPDKSIESVSLRFILAQIIPASVLFYNHVEEPAHNAPELEAKASHWQVMLSKLLSASPDRPDASTPHYLSKKQTT